MSDYQSSPEDKLIEFILHVNRVSPHKFEVSSKFYHPINFIVEELEKQLGLRNAARYVKPFQSLEQLKGLMPKDQVFNLEQYNPCFRSLFECWGMSISYYAHQDTERFINSVKQDLNAAKEYACNDAVTFRNVIAPGNDDAVMERLERICGNRTEGNGIPQIPRNAGAYLNGMPSTTWDPAHLASTYRRVVRQKSGECNSFGYFGAHLLHQANQITAVNHRIEVVSWDVWRDKQVTLNKVKQWKKPKKGKYFTPHWENIPGLRKPQTRVQYTTHVFVVVNRKGGTKPGLVGRPPKPKLQLPPSSEWGKECWVVDPWLASLGFDSAWPVARYPKPGMLNPTHLQMDNRNLDE